MDINNLANLFMMIVVTGLGGAKLLEMWQAYTLKSNEKKLDHNLKQDTQAFNLLIAQAERNRQRIESIETDKFTTLTDKLTACEVVLNDSHETLNKLYEKAREIEEHLAKLQTQLGDIATL